MIMKMKQKKVKMKTTTNKRKVFACDFETTVYDEQTDTEVWSAAFAQLYTDDVKVAHSIESFFEYMFSFNDNITLYFHNLKFDGSFILSYLLNNSEFKQAFESDRFLTNKDMPNNSYKYLISIMGQWYSITIKTNNHYIEIRDSLKLMPFSLKEIGKAFNTEHRKLDMEYKGRRYAGCEITDEEMAYIKNDVLVLKEALEIMFQQGHDKMTIGSCCLEEYKRTIDRKDFQDFFPDIYSIELDEDLYGSPNAGEYIKKSYKGGWCYVAKGKEKKVFTNGLVLDVNSLYPSMMSSESGNCFPVGEPHFWKGRIPKEAEIGDRYYFVRIRTRFNIKKGKLPFIQIKNSFLYRGNECLECSDVIIGNTVYKDYINPNGTYNDGKVELTLTMVDYKLIQEHYDLFNLEILDGCWFHSMSGIFDMYINKYKEMKLNNKGALRTLAKLFLNNLYGKMASSPDSSFKVAFLKDGVVTFEDVRARDKKPGYIPVGSAITSYARNFTIRTAQKNYYGPYKAGFIYADTDSIHCDLPIEKVKGVKLHDKNFCCWKKESEWDYGFFSRQKTYIEHLVEKDGNKLDEPFYNIVCAGMPTRSKYLFNVSLGGKRNDDIVLTKEEQEFVEKRRTIADFDTGLTVPGKLVQKRIVGGCVLAETTFEMK